MEKMLQAGERIRGRENMRAFHQFFPEHSDPPSMSIRRVLVRDGLWVVEGVNDCGGGSVSTVVLILGPRDGKMLGDTRYYAEPFEAPEWRTWWS